MSQVELRGLSKSFGPVHAVRDVSLDIPDHSFVTLLGPSGCGKTTTLNMTAGLERATEGAVLLDGKDVTGWAPHERGMAMVFQNYALYPHKNVFENIAFALRLQRRPRDEIERRVRATAEALELGALLTRRIAQLSGGQQQRVALARAMAKEPQVFLFDEPLSNLDAGLRTRLRVEIKRLHQQLRTTSIFVTHDQEEALELADEVVVMRNARIEQIGSPQEVYDKPRSPFVYEFLGNVNKLTAPEGTHEYIRPHEIEIRFAAECEPLTDELGTIHHLFSAGPIANLSIRLDNGSFLDVEISRKILDEMCLDRHDRIAVKLRPEPA